MHTKVTLYCSILSHCVDLSFGVHFSSTCILLLRLLFFIWNIKKTPWSESASELYRPSDRLLSAKWLPTCANRRCHVVSVTDSYGRISRFSRQEPLLFYQVAPQLYWRVCVDPVPDPLPGLRICSQELWPLDHRGGLYEIYTHIIFVHSWPYSGVQIGFTAWALYEALLLPRVL
jgi:hypothetical protein